MRFAGAVDGTMVSCCCQQGIDGWVLTDQGCWGGKDGPVEVVEAVGDVAGEFDVLLLVFADGDVGRSGGVGVSIPGKVMGFERDAYRWTKISAACRTG